MHLIDTFGLPLMAANLIVFLTAQDSDRIQALTEGVAIGFFKLVFGRLCSLAPHGSGRTECISGSSAQTQYAPD